MQELARKSDELVTYGWVIDHKKEKVVYVRMIDEFKNGYNYYSKETDNYYLEMDVYESELVALEHYLGDVIKNKKEMILYYNELEMKLTSRIADIVYE